MIEQHHKDRFVIKNYINDIDSDFLKFYFDQNSHLCTNLYDHHKNSTLYLRFVKNDTVKTLMHYYQLKGNVFVDQIFNTKQVNWDEASIVRRTKGWSHPIHCDADQDINFGSIVYLNNDYGGGELLFEDGQKFKLEKNSCIFFRGDIKNRHEVLEITEGKRYTLPAWYTK